MNSRVFCIAAALTLTALGGCNNNKHAMGEDPAQCKAVKAGTVTSINKMCAVENDDPVNPAVEPVMWKGQKVGFCCNGCKPKWAKMTDAEKDKAVAAAVAKPAPQ